mmetsp:Transcript_3683/g.14479  ORF Transcript_3683/g.14479 Transcript_3683/m.14479 type:complete len:251 (-) Transcript_3683:571-1323(-)
MDAFLSTPQCVRSQLISFSVVKSATTPTTACARPAKPSLPFAILHRLWPGRASASASATSSIAFPCSSRTPGSPSPWEGRRACCRWTAASCSSYGKSSPSSAKASRIFPSICWACRKASLATVRSGGTISCAAQPSKNHCSTLSSSSSRQPWMTSAARSAHFPQRPPCPPSSMTACEAHSIRIFVSDIRSSSSGPTGTSAWASSPACSAARAVVAPATSRINFCVLSEASRARRAASCCLFWLSRSEASA